MQYWPNGPKVREGRSTYKNPEACANVEGYGL